MTINSLPTDYGVNWYVAELFPLDRQLDEELMFGFWGWDMTRREERSGIPGMKRGRPSSPIGPIKLRQVYSRDGYNFMSITIPMKLMAAVGWKPGDYLMVYPFKDKSGLEGAKLVLQSNVLGVADPELDVGILPHEIEEMRGIRPGSIASRIQHVDDVAQDMIWKATKGVEGRPMANVKKPDWWDQK